MRGKFFQRKSAMPKTQKAGQSPPSILFPQPPDLGRASSRTTALVHRLVGKLRVIFAIGRRILRIATAEMKVVRQRIANRPLACALGEIRQRQTARDRHDDAAGSGVFHRLRNVDVLIFLEGVCTHRPCCGTGCVASGKARRARSCGRWALRCRAIGRRRTACFGATRKVETVHFADHGIAAYASKLGCNLAGAETFRP